MRSLFDKKTYRATEIAEVFGIGKSTVWQYVKQGKLKSEKISPRVTIFKADEVHEFFGLDVKSITEKKKKLRRKKKSREELRQSRIKRRREFQKIKEAEKRVDVFLGDCNE